MRVLFLNQYFPPDSAATAYLLGELAEDVARHHEVWVVAGRPSYNPEANVFRPKGVRVLRVRSTGFSRERMSGRAANYASFVAGSLLAAMRVPRPDVVVAMTDPPIIGVVGAAVASRHGARFISVYADLFPEIAVALRRMDHPAMVSVWRRLNGFVRARADRIVAVGRDMLERLERQSVPREKLEFIPNWANGDVPSEETVAGVRRAMGWEGRYVVMHAGNIGLAQGLDALIEAADRLRHREDLVIAFVGDGAARRGLAEAVAARRLSNVEFHGYRPKEEAQAILASADLHVVSLAHGLWGCAVPSKLYGILGLGLPFVAAVEEGSEVDRVIRETGAGVRVDPGDAAGLARAIEAYVDGEVDGKAAGERGRKEFERSYERSVGTRRYLRLLESVGRMGDTPSLK